MSHDAHDEGGHDEHDGPESHNDAEHAHEADAQVDSEVGFVRRSVNNLLCKNWKSKALGVAGGLLMPPFGWIASPIAGYFAGPLLVKKAKEWWQWGKNTYSIGGTPAAAHP